VNKILKSVQCQPEAESESELWRPQCRERLVVFCVFFRPV